MTGPGVRGRAAPVVRVCLAVAAVAAVLTGALLAAFASRVGLLYQLPGMGVIVDFGLPAARVLAFGAAAVTVANLLLATVLAPGEPDGTVSADGVTGLRAAAGWAGLQALASLVVVFLTVAENTTVPPVELLSRPTVLFSGTTMLQPATGWAVCAVLALLVGTLAARTRSWPGAAGLLALVFAGLSAVTPTAITDAAGSLDLARDAVTIHGLGAVLWIGSTVAVAVHAGRSGAERLVVLRRHNLIATGSLLLVGGSGILLAALTLDPTEVLSTGYGLLVLATVAVLVVLAALRRRMLAAFATSTTPAATPAGTTTRTPRLVVLELLVLACAACLGTGLTRLLPLDDPDRAAGRLLFLIGYELPAHLNAVDLLVRWRWDLLFGTTAVLAGAGYLLALRRLRRSGGRWPRRRTAAWLAGCATVVLATCSGIGTYAPAVFSVHMVQHTLLATFAPVLLVLGHGVTLTLRVAGERGGSRLTALLDAPVVRLLRHLVVAWAAVAATMFGLYPTGLFAELAQDHWAHPVLNLAFLGTGLALFWPVLGRSLGERNLPPIGRIVLVFAVMSLHAAFSAWLLSRAVPVAEPFYSTLQLPFVPDLLADQRRGAILAWILGELPVILAVLALVRRWARTEDAPLDQPTVEIAGSGGGSAEPGADALA